jgi:predicted TIM-barrel fold metal-dependent hydrolase
VFEARYPYSPRRGYTPPDAPYEAYRHLLDVLGATRAVLAQPSAYGTDNSAILDAVARDPSNMRAVAAVDAGVTDEQLRALDAAGVRGIRVNLVDKGGMPFDSFDDVERFASRIAPMGWHIEYLVHVHDFPELDALARMPVDAVVGHFGYMPTTCGVDHPGYRAFLRLVERGRIWVKLTAPYRITASGDLPYEDVEPLARGAARGAPGPAALGQRLAARHQPEADGQRRRSVRPDCRLAARGAAARAGAGRQPQAPLRLRLIRPARRHGSHRA